MLLQHTRKQQSSTRDKNSCRSRSFGRLSSKYTFLTLNSDQTRLLYSFQSMMVAFDILNTKKKDLALAKSKWKDEWEDSVCESLETDRNEFFIRSGRQAFDLMEKISNEIEDRSWIDLLVLELSRFMPYYQLGLEENKAYKKLRLKNRLPRRRLLQGPGLHQQQRRKGNSEVIYARSRNDNRQ